MMKLLLLLFAFSQAFFPFSLGDRLSGELFRAVFHSNQNEEFKKKETDLARQKENQQNPELQDPFSFVPGENCHSVMTEAFGKFSLPMHTSNRRSNIWCNWIIWAGPRRHILVNITGFVSNEDCATNQDVIIFHAIASTAESTVINACWNKNLHSFSARAVALNVVYMSQRSSQMHASAYFNGSYSVLEDYESSNLKYSLFFSPSAKEKEWHNSRGKGKTTSSHPLGSPIAVTNVPMKGKYTGDTNTVSRPLSFLSFATSWKKTSYKREQFLNQLKSTKNSKGAPTSTGDAVNPSEGHQILPTKPAERPMVKDAVVNMQGTTESSSIPKTTWLFTTTKHQEKSIITLNAYTSSERGLGHSTAAKVEPFPNVKQTLPVKLFYQVYNSSSPADDNDSTQAELIQRGDGTVKNNSFEKGLRFTTEFSHLNQATNVSQSKPALPMEMPVDKEVTRTPRQMQGASSRTGTIYVGAGVTPTKVHQNGFTAKSRSQTSVIFPRQATSSNLVVTAETVQQTPFNDQQTSPDSKTIRYSKSFQDTANYSLVHNYGPSISDKYGNEASSQKDPITKSNVFVKTRKNKKKNPAFKSGKKNKRKNLETGNKNNKFETISVLFSKSNSAATPPVRVVKALKTRTSVATQRNIDPQSSGPQSPPPLQEPTLGFNGFSPEGGLILENNIDAVRSLDMTTLEARQRADTFGAVAVGLSNNSALEKQHNPGDTLFMLVIVIGHQDILPEKEQERDLLESLKEKIKEYLMDTSNHLNEIKLQYIQRTTKFKVAISFWIHLKHGGKEMHFFQTQLKKFKGISFGNGKYVPISVSIEDIDECEFGIDSCGENAECQNEMGTYACPCRNGYEEHVSDLSGPACVRSQPAGSGFLFSYLEILLGTLLGVILLMVFAVVVSCALVKKRQVKRTLSLSAEKGLAGQPHMPRPSFAHVSIDSENTTHRIFPVVKLATVEGPATSRRSSTNIAKVTMEQSACL